MSHIIENSLPFSLVLKAFNRENNVSPVFYALFLNDLKIYCATKLVKVLKLSFNIYIYFYFYFCFTLCQRYSSFGTDKKDLQNH